MGRSLVEGDIVVVPNKRVIDGKAGDPKIGTIARILLEKRCLVLDSDGILHLANIHEVYLAQNEGVT